MKELDSITLTSIASEKAGMSYGKYVALFGVVTKQGEETDTLVAPKVCQERGRTFFGRARNMKFCSEECRKKSDNRKFGKKYRELRAERAKNRVCAYCGKEFPTAGRSVNCKYCGLDCANMANKVRSREYTRKKRALKAET